MTTPPPPDTPLPPAIFLMGPTASGKTAVALHLADVLGADLPVDLISVDSALIYRDMDIGTAKPDRETLARYPHALVDILSPEASYSAARFRDDALAAMAESQARGHLPVLVGGTMLYFKALRDGLADLPQADPALRAQLEAEARERGWPALHGELQRGDPETAARLHPTDSQRIQRALEILRQTGRTMSELLRESQARQSPLPYRVLSLSLLPSHRQVLHERIALRFQQMLDQGLEAEVSALRQRYRLQENLPSMRCVGYRQVWDMQEGRIPRAELADRGIFATRQLAKRQITWMSSFPEAEVFDCIDSRLAATLTERVYRFLD